MGLTREDCVRLLQNKAKEQQRYPKKSDFIREEVCAIKSYFGPWPRALEHAGVKEPAIVNREEQKRQKRIERKRAINAKKKQLKNMAEKKGRLEQ